MSTPPLASARSAERARARSRHRSDRRLGYALVTPVVLLLLAVTGFPMVYNLWNSFHFDNLSYGGAPHRFVGWANYAAMFTSPEWLAALERTLIFTVVSVALELVIALALALMLHRRFRGRGLLRVAILIPWAVPTVVSATLWKTMFDPRAGFVDYLLGAIHPAWSSLAWANANVSRSWIVIFVADAWKNVPFIALILLAGLQVIPTEIYEAARIDGASAFQSFRRMTLPLLKPAIAVAVIFRTLQAFFVFDVVYILTGGGPGNSTETLSFLSYQTFINNTDFGVGGAMSIMLIIIGLAISLVYVRLLRPAT